jgi:hypothetical protein
VDRNEAHSGSSGVADFDHDDSGTGSVADPQKRGDRTMRAGNIDDDLTELAEETVRVAESIGEPAISLRLHEIALGLRELALAQRHATPATEGCRLPLRMRHQDSP